MTAEQQAYNEQDHRDPVNSQKEKNIYYFYHIIQASWKQVPQQELELDLVEVLDLLMAPNNTTD
jgi:hypothetical protein